jgi:DNA repair protein SbcC/Rad50
MKILAIRGKNLASIEGEFEIDFTREPLLSAGIFAITGPTGSGKSTILDALCLALFARSPRQAAGREQGVELRDGEAGKISPNDPRAILRKGTAEGYAEVVFAGVDGNAYHSTWSVRRSRNRASGNLQDYSLQLRNLTSGAVFGEKKTETLREIEKLIGLSYDQFTRSVLLAQGDFTAFLKAGRDDKAALLEKLTGTAIYSDISKSIYERTKAAESFFQEINIRLKGITLLDEAVKGEIYGQKVEFENYLKDKDSRKDSLRKELEWFLQSEHLSNEVLKARLALELAEKQKTEAADTISTLNLIEQVQPAARLVVARNEKTANWKQKQESLVENNILLQQLDEKLAKLKSAEEVVVLTLDQAELAITEAQPSMKLAAELDTLMVSQSGLLADAQRESDIAGQKVREQKALLLTKSSLCKSLNDEIREIENWLDENRMRQPIVENLPLIESELKNAKKLREGEAKGLSQMSAVKVSLQQVFDEAQKLEAGSKTENDRLGELQNLIGDMEAQLSAMDSGGLESRERETHSLIQQLTEAQSCWEKLFESKNNLALLKQKAESTSGKLETAEIDLKEAAAFLSEAGIRRDQTKTLLTQAQLRASDTAESLRGQLVSNEPCPVCGSHNHPYVAADQSFHPVLMELEKEYGKWSRNYDEWVKKCAGLEKDCQTYNTSMEQMDLEMAECEMRISGLKPMWDEYKLPPAIYESHGTIRLEVFRSELALLRKEGVSMRNQLDEYKKLATGLEADKNELVKVKEALFNNEKQLSELNNRRSLLEQEENQTGKSISGFREEYRERIATLNTWFVQPGWEGNWAENPDEFSEKLQGFAVVWNGWEESLKETRKKLQVAVAEEIMLKDQLAESQKILAVAGNKLAGQQAEYSRLEDQRKSIFGGRPLVEVESDFRLQMDKYRSELSEVQKGVRLIQSEKDGLNGILRQLQHDLELHLDEKEEANITLMEWIRNFNLQNDQTIIEVELLSLLNRSAVWIAENRKEVQQINDNILTAVATLTERDSQWNRHLSNRSGDVEKDTLEQNLANLEEEIKNLTAAKNELEFRLKEDENNRKAAGELLSELEKRREIQDRWQKLNEILGSADGKKFRQIAQEYTLEVLLGYANVHLKELSARYELEVVPDSLALQVIDRDMGDEVRSVLSLSGGESFLVSLALALGLASLSSNRMNVESLFIDEGFGSLDPLTLNIAMDALEQLHNKGRKVGVISHVQEMTERILTKIEVKKLSGGKSKILITSS